MTAVVKRKDPRHDTESFDEFLGLGGGNEPARHFREVDTHTRETEEQVKTVLADFGHVISSPTAIRTVAEMTVRIQVEHQNITKSFLKIGRCLLEIETQLGTEDSLYAYAASGLIPFSKGQISKLKTATRDYDAGRFARAVGRPVEETDLPSLTTLYLLRTLSDDKLKVAAERGLIAPGTTAAEVIKFKEEIKGEEPPPATKSKELMDLEAEEERISTYVTKLQIKLRRAQKQLTEIQARISEINT